MISYPESVIKILQIFEKNNFSAYIVGGCVRDSLMGKAPADWDITTSATPDDMQRIFKDENIRTLPTGLKHGTVSVLLDGEIYECTTYRTEGEYTDCRHPDFVEFTDNIRLDLSRRDFTINAMASSPTRGICDFFGGADDLERRTIRCVGEAEKRFSEDALRILRAVRFATVLGFKIEEKTLCAIKKLSHLLTHISSERKTSELSKILTSEFCDRGIELLLETGVMPYLLPDVTPCKVSVIHAKKSFPFRLGALLLACGGTDTRLLCLSNEEKKILNFSTEQIPFDDTPEGARRCLGKYGDLALDVCALQRRYVLFELLSSEEIISSPVNIKQLAIDGNELMAMGYSGKTVGEILNFLLEEVLKNPSLNNKDTLTTIIKSNFGA